MDDDAARIPRDRYGLDSPDAGFPAERAVAFVIDGVLAFVATTVAVYVGIGTSTSWVFASIYAVPALVAIALTVTTAIGGWTPGKLAMRLRVVRADTGGRPGLRAVPRSAVIIAPWLLGIALEQVLPAVGIWAGFAQYVPVPLWIGLLGVMVARRGDRYRGVQDLAARSLVVRVR